MQIDGRYVLTTEADKSAGRPYEGLDSIVKRHQWVL